MGLAGQNNERSLYGVVWGEEGRKMAFVLKMTAGDPCIEHP